MESKINIEFRPLTGNLNKFQIAARIRANNIAHRDVEYYLAIDREARLRIVKEKYEETIRKRDQELSNAIAEFQRKYEAIKDLRDKVIACINLAISAGPAIANVELEREFGFTSDIADPFERFQAYVAALKP
jgi:hypothetical protein